MARRRTRLALVWSYLTVVGLGGCAGLVLAAGPALIVQFVAFLAMPILAILMNRSTRGVANVPDEALDDLHVRLVDRIYRVAYRLLSSVAMVVGAAVIWGHDQLPAQLLLATGWLLVGLSLGLPSMVAALTFPDPGTS
jgi:hypothetical protein